MKSITPVIIGLTMVGLLQFVVAQQPNPQAKVQTVPVAPPKEGTVNWPYWGSITEVTKDSVTIEYKGEKPQKFVVSETLASGGVPRNPRLQPGRTQGYHVSPTEMYRLIDVKVGDFVMITCARIGGVDICDHIKIWRRPGGRVPPLPDEAEWLASIEGSFSEKGRASLTPELLAKIRAMDGKRIRYHEQMNAYWDLEEKGIPYPEKFGADRRWPIAPMPRELVQPR